MQNAVLTKTVHYSFIQQHFKLANVKFLWYEKWLQRLEFFPLFWWFAPTEDAKTTSCLDFLELLSSEPIERLGRVPEQLLLNIFRSPQSFVCSRRHREAQTRPNYPLEGLFSLGYYVWFLPVGFGMLCEWQHRHSLGNSAGDLVLLRLMTTSIQRTDFAHRVYIYYRFDPLLPICTLLTWKQKQWDFVFFLKPRKSNGVEKQLDSSHMHPWGTSGFVWFDKG